MISRIFIASLLLADISRGAEFVFVNGDAPGEGLNDPTLVAPVGGNPGGTLGAQRLAALERAGKIWGAYLVSDVPIRVQVEFEPLAAGTLAGASSDSLQENFVNAPLQDTWYPVALANGLAGVDLEPAEDNISVTANSGGTFYYGFDSATPFSQSNFLDVLLHELGHGLGFISFANNSTGTLFAGQPDVFTRLIFDKQFNRTWPQLTSSQRQISALNDPFLTWTGPFTTAGLPAKLAVQNSTPGFRLTADFPGEGPRQLAFLKAVFDAPFPPGGLAGTLVATDPALVCGPILNGVELAGNIALIRRGECDFDSKVYAAQQAGAVAVIIANNVDTGILTPGGDGLVDGQPVDFLIPAVFVSRDDGDALLAALPDGEISFTPMASGLAGTVEGELRLHAPAVLSSGSSVSHWTTAASPNLLMEPFINPNLDRKLDLTLTQMKDIGWRVVDIPFPHLTFDSWRTLVFNDSDILTGPGDDPDQDGVSNLEEYFFGSDPKSSGTAELPVFRIAGGERELVFTRSKLPVELGYALEKSTDLEDFTEAVLGVDYEITGSADVGIEAEEITLRLLAPPPGGLFLRLRIQTEE